MNKISLLFLCGWLLLIVMACQSGKATTGQAALNQAPNSQERMEKERNQIPGPPVVIYKTIKDYSDNIPVEMDATRREIVSYPAPDDIYYEGRLARPTRLVDGYLLDNNGITPQVAFLSYTYEEYSKLEKSPSIDTLKARIIDRNPLSEFWKCGVRSQAKDEVNTLNEMIKAGFPGYRNEVMSISFP